MSPPLALQAALVALEAAAASVALPLAAGLLARFEPRNASRRHLIWALALGLLLVLPALLAVTPSLAVVRLSPGPSVTSVAVAPAPEVNWTGLAILAAAGTWICGAALLATKRLLALAALDRLRRQSALALPVDRVELRYGQTCTGPMTWGLLRPVILLPAAARHWPAERLNAVLAHELAHVRRRDSLVQALAAATCALYWPNPLVWRAAKALRREAEMAADDAVIASGARPSDYAELLLGLARERQGGPTPALAMAGPSALTERVQSILSPMPLRNGASPMDIVKLAGLGALAAGTLLAVRPSLAENVPAPVTAPVVAAATLPPVAAAVPTTPAAAKPKTQRHPVHRFTTASEGQSPPPQPRGTGRARP